ncbi:MAG: BLUF domain-containing protein [Caulobacterales bacterium]
MLNRLVYFSERLCGDDEIAALASTSAPRNKVRNVTGLLMADESCFIQILEGPRAAVSSLFQEISRDPRHRDLVLVEMSEIAALSYPSWGMAHVSDPARTEEVWKRVMRQRSSPWPMSALQLRGLLKIALGYAAPKPANVNAPTAALAGLAR